MFAVNVSNVTVSRLRAEEEAEVLYFLTERIASTFGMVGFIRSNGIVSPHNRGTFYACRNAEGELDGVALIGHATLFEARTDAAIAAFARIEERYPRELPAAVVEAPPAAFAIGEPLAGFSNGTAFLRSPDNEFVLFPTGRLQLDTYLFQSTNKVPNNTVLVRRARIERDRGRFLSAISLALYYYRDAMRWKVLGEGALLAHEDLRREIGADARGLSLPALTRRVRILEEIAAAVQSNVTAAYAVASAQYRMGLGPEETFAGGPARAGIRHG